MATDRERLLEEALAAFENGLEDFKPGTHGYHEAVDRTSNIMSIIDGCLLGHPTILADEELYKDVELSFNTLHNVYKKLMEKHK